jgi:hypothetical protein
MVKVQNGWESHSIEQLETLPTRLSEPSTPITQNSYNHRPGTSGSRRHSIYSESSERYIHSPGSQTSPRMLPPYVSSGISNSHWQHSSVHQNASNHRPSNGPTLAPAAPISSSRPGRRSLSSRAPPNLITARMPYATSGQPTTPTSTPVRQGILRMPSGQAEKDALETLLFMSSPNNSSNAKFASGAADPSPLRSEFSPQVKRVIFEGH